MKNCSYTAIGVIAGVAAVVTGLCADMISCKNESAMNRITCDLRHKASRAMHTLGDKIDKAADNIS